MGEKIPLSYSLLEQSILEERARLFPPIIQLSRLFDLAKTCSIADPEALVQDYPSHSHQEVFIASNLLHNFGILVHFADDVALKHLVILDPQWITRLLSTLISTKQMFSQKGLLRHSDLRHIWHPPDYPEALYGHFLWLLKKFEIAYEISDALTVRTNVSTAGQIASDFPIMVKITADYAPVGEYEIRVLQGERYRVTQSDPSGYWYLAEANDKRGWIPSDCCVVSTSSAVHLPLNTAPASEFTTPTVVKELTITFPWGERKLEGIDSFLTVEAILQPLVTATGRKLKV